MAELSAIEAKRKVILAAEAKMEYFLRQIQERPKLAGLWRYWFNWYRVRRADWLTRAYLEQVRGWKALMHQWEREGTVNSHLADLEKISRNLSVIEDGLQIIEVELKETLEIAQERQWRIRYPRPQTTMVGWIHAIHERYPIIKDWIRRIREELPALWIDFVYVIYYAYVSPGAERHLEAHLESKCISKDQIKKIVKQLSNKLLRAFVAAPRVVGGELEPGYAQPLLRAEMAKPPYEGRIHQDNNLWQWGIEWNAQINYNVGDQRVVPTEATGEVAAPKTVPMRLELFDYDYVSLRSYKEAELPAQWWLLPLEELLKLLGIEVER